MARTGKMLRPQVILLWVAVSMATMATTGCGNAGEGTVTVSPEARAKLQSTAAPDGKATPKKSTFIRGKIRRAPEG